MLIETVLRITVGVLALALVVVRLLLPRWAWWAAHDHSQLELTVDAMVVLALVALLTVEAAIILSQ